MPVIKGDEFLMKTHVITPKTLNILLTGQATIEGVTNSINDANLYHFISKPWDAADLILTVEQAIKSYYQQNQLEEQNAELRELSSSLERKVKDRTQELEEKNQLLTERQKEISAQNEELEKYRTHLEELVEKRTVELTLAMEKAQESERLKSAFMANISHEIRTPMNGIIGFIELLRDPDVEKDTQSEFLEIIENCSRQLMGIITDIVEISKLETHLVKPVLSKCKIKNVVDTVSAVFLQAMSLNSEVILINNCMAEHIHCWTDVVKLNQILTNLISNALKNTNKGSIELGSMLNEDNNLLFYVRDTGIGISKENHTIIFDRFRQIDTTLTRNQGGTGLGLAITKAYVELLGGKIWLESEPGKGSTFYVSIPFLPVQEDSVRVADVRIENTHSSEGITILVAEDVDINYELLKTILHKQNMIAIRARDGQEAIDLCRENSDIELVLMDIKMPKIDGYEATRQILRFRPDLPIIAQTAYAFADDNNKAIESGCLECIHKPIKGDDLIRLVNNYLVVKCDKSTS